MAADAQRATRSREQTSFAQTPEERAAAAAAYQQALANPNYLTHSRAAVAALAEVRIQNTTPFTLNASDLCDELLSCAHGLAIVLGDDQVRQVTCREHHAKSIDALRMLISLAIVAKDAA